MSTRTTTQVTVVLIAGVCCLDGSRSSQAQTPLLSDICYRTTHNSYSRGFRPNVQIDDYNVWEVEIDFGREVGRDFEVGHNYMGEEVDVDPPMPTLYLRDWLQNIKDSASWRFHPVAIKLEKKGWMSGDEWQDELRTMVSSVLGAENILTKSEFEDKDKYDSQWPPVGELAGRFLLLLLNAQQEDGFFFVNRDPPGFPGLCVACGGGDCCYGIGEWLRFFRDLKASPNCDGAPPANRIVMDDAYLKDFSNWGVHPPVPIHVDAGSSSPDMWRRLGTRIDPVQRVGFAANMARIIPVLPDSLVAGRLAHTVLRIKAGSYPEKLTLNKPMTIEAVNGSALIGGSEVATTVWLEIADDDDAGTDGSISVRLNGVAASCPWVPFNQAGSGDLCERGTVNPHQVSIDDIGELESVTVWVDDHDDMKIQCLYVDSAVYGRYYIQGNVWVGLGHQVDGRLTLPVTAHWE